MVCLLLNSSWNFRNDFPPLIFLFFNFTGTIFIVIPALDAGINV